MKIIKVYDDTYGFLLKKKFCFITGWYLSNEYNEATVEEAIKKFKNENNEEKQKIVNIFKENSIDETSVEIFKETTKEFEKIYKKRAQ